MANVVNQALDTANADLQLLTSSLSNSRKISHKATVMLSHFDDRLARLEKMVSAFHSDMVPVQRVNNISALLAAIDGMLGQSDALDKEEVAIAKGPRLNNLDSYKNSLAALVDSFEQASRTASNRDSDMLLKRLNKAIEPGVSQLGQIMLGWVREASPADLRAMASISRPLLDKILSISEFIHVVPEACSGAVSAQRDIQRSFAEIRGNAVATCLNDMARDVLKQGKAANGGVTVIESIIDAIFSSAKTELGLASQIFPPHAVNHTFRCFCSVALPALTEVGQQINNLAKRSIITLAVLAFRSYAALEARKSQFEDQIRHKAGRKENEFADILHTLRATCLNSFPEFLDEVKAWGARTATADAAPDQIADMTKNTVAFMQHLCDYQPISERFLQTLGDGNWNLNTKTASVTPKISSMDDSASLLEKYLGDLMSALLNALDSKTQALKQSKGSATATAPIFLLNNLSFIRRERLESNIGDFLGDRAEDDLNKRNRSAKTLYLEVFGGLVSSLMDGGLSTSGRPGAQDKFAKFNEALTEVERAHRMARLDPGEEEMRDRLRTEVEKMVLPTYRSAVGRNGNAPSKTRILAPDEVADRLGALFS